jgi:hypothetical protein
MKGMKGMKGMKEMIEVFLPRMLCRQESVGERQITYYTCQFDFVDSSCRFEASYQK